MRTCISDKGEFLNSVPAAQAVLDFVDRECSQGLRWYFKECWADFPADAYDMLFRSYVTPEFKDHSLQVSACLGVNGWTIREEYRSP